MRDNKTQVAAKMFPLWMMLAAGCDKNIANNEGKNAVYYAMEKFTKGKALDGDTALIKAVRDNPCKHEAKYTAIRTILALGADPNIRNNDGKIAIDFAKKQDIIDILKQGGTK